MARFLIGLDRYWSSAQRLGTPVLIGLKRVDSKNKKFPWSINSIIVLHTYIYTYTHVCLCGHRHTSFAHMVPDTESVLTFAPTPHFLCFYLYNH